MQVSISRLHFPVTALGPGRRVGLWFQGCSIRCPGCISRDTWEAGEGMVGLDDVLAELSGLAVGADGLTVSGGEPFDQSEALAWVLRYWRGASDESVLVFTGYEREAVAPWLAEHPGLIDALITGPFRSQVPQTRALRGSDNQQLHILTALGEQLAGFERAAGPEDRRLDVMFDGDGHAWLAGIPARGELARLRRLLAGAGHKVVTSEMVGAGAGAGTGFGAGDRFEGAGDSGVGRGAVGPDKKMALVGSLVR
ncbi:radical SAM protein [Sphingomonas sp. So64.6b]|nr:radical SAM protein [Sphingomonas sp. So64.6b]